LHIGVGDEVAQHTAVLVDGDGVDGVGNAHGECSWVVGE
jgi:hypothetical protein